METETGYEENIVQKVSEETESDYCTLPVVLGRCVTLKSFLNVNVSKGSVRVNTDLETCFLLILYEERFGSRWYLSIRILDL